MISKDDIIGVQNRFFTTESQRTHRNQTISHRDHRGHREELILFPIGRYRLETKTPFDLAVLALSNGQLFNRVSRQIKNPLYSL
jgi:hypothetical protein